MYVKTKSHSYVTNLALVLRINILMYILQLFVTCSYVLYCDDIPVIFFNATVQLLYFIWALDQLHNFSLDSRFLHVVKFIVYIIFDSIFLLNVQLATSKDLEMVPYFLLRTITSVLASILECSAFYYSSKISISSLQNSFQENKAFSV